MLLRMYKRFLFLRIKSEVRLLDKTEATTQFGFPYSSFFSALSEVLNDDDISIDMYREMIDRDETVGAGLDFFTENVILNLGSYTHTNAELQTFINENFENMNETLEIVLNNYLTELLAFGYGVAEKVYEEKNGKLYLKRIVVLPSDTCRFTVANGEVSTVVQYTATRGKIEIPADKCVIMQLGRGVYGKSRLRRIYRVYAFKKALFRFWAVAMERYAMPITHAKATDPSQILEPLKTLWTEGIVATDPNTQIELLEPKAAMADVYRDTIEYLNMLIYRGLLVPQLLTSAGSTGAYSLGQVHFQIFQNTAQRYAQRLSSVLIDQVVAQLIDWNYGKQLDYGRFVNLLKPTPEEMQNLAQVFSSLVDSAVLDPVEDEQWIRAMLGFPERKEDTTSDTKEADELWQGLEA